jgi:hypothetical protein
MTGPHLVVALEPTPAPAVVGYVADLVDAGIPVGLVLVDEAAVARFRDSGAVPARPHLDVLALVPDEKSLWLPRLLSGRLRRLYSAVVRPWLLGRRWRALDTRAASAERVVAADVAAITLVWHLGRRHPHVVATTALEPPAALRRTS